MRDIFSFFIPEPNWYAEPTHHDKCVAGAFFELKMGKKSATRAHKLDSFRIKKYYSYYIKKTDLGDYMARDSYYGTTQSFI